ncbi:MAG: aldo/keto reductase [Propionibacteriaceae bacterium]|jgi:aryl-alcohol dehydrogenase-like predicted oxidoreductase|nr:aldo/keto reductase [Propionibacteriaceae bacterium]
MLRIGTLKVAPLCLGGNVFGWTADATTSEAILNAYLDGGGNFVDTADTYSTWVPGHPGGESERIIGNWLRGRAKTEVVVASKVAKHPQRRGLRPSNIRVCLDGSRRRLGMETIDLYYAHADDPSVPTAEWVGAFNDLIADGSIKHYGLSNFTAERVREVCAVAKENGLATPVAVQPEYNLVHRGDVENGLVEAAVELGIAILPYYGLASGFLTGKYARDEAVRGPRAGTVKRYATDEGFAVVDKLVEIGDALNTEPAAVALAWLRQQPGVAAPIASASIPEQVPTLLAAMTLKLTRGQINKLSKVSAPFV